MATAVHLSTNSSETKVVTNLKKAYSSEGVPTLNVASKGLSKNANHNTIKVQYWRLASAIESAIESAICAISKPCY